MLELSWFPVGSTQARATTVVPLYVSDFPANTGVDFKLISMLYMQNIYGHFSSQRPNDVVFSQFEFADVCVCLCVSTSEQAREREESGRAEWRVQLCYQQRFGVWSVLMLRQWPQINQCTANSQQFNSTCVTDHHRMWLEWSDLRKHSGHAPHWCKYFFLLHQFFWPRDSKNT